MKVGIVVLSGVRRGTRVQGSRAHVCVLLAHGVRSCVRAMQSHELFLVYYAAAEACVAFHCLLIVKMQQWACRAMKRRLCHGSLIVCLRRVLTGTMHLLFLGCPCGRESG